MSNRFSSGYILVAVLVFMQLFSLISLYGLTLASTSMKQNKHGWYGYVDRLKSHIILQRIESSITNESAACLISLIPPGILAKKPLAWWQLNTCSDNVNGIRYYYALESLGDDPCSVISNQDNQAQLLITKSAEMLIAKYYRITLFIQPDKLNGGRYLLQSTVALPGAQTVNCQQESHRIQPGRQRWREI